MTHAEMHLRLPGATKLRTIKGAMGLPNYDNLTDNHISCVSKINI